MSPECIWFLDTNEMRDVDWFLMEDRNLTISRGENQSCRWSGDTMSQRISTHDKDQVCMQYSISGMGRGVTIRLATIRYISRYTTHDMVHDTIQNQLIYYQWKILKHCGMCHQYCYIKTVILARNSEFKINKDLHNHPCPKYQLLTNCVCKQNNKIS